MIVLLTLVFGLVVAVYADERVVGSDGADSIELEQLKSKIQVLGLHFDFCFRIRLLFLVIIDLVF